MTDGSDAYDATPALRRWRHWTDVPLAVLAIGSLPLLALETKRDVLPRHDLRFLDLMNLVVFLAFLVDYVVELGLARPRGAYVRKEWAGALIVVAQGLAVVPSLSAFGVARVARAGRALRILVLLARVFATGGIATREGRAAVRRNAASFALGLAGFTWIMSAVLFTMVEDVGTGHHVDSFFDGLWWSLCTITTVGYGDVVPVTPAGRIVAGVTMIVGISTFAIVTAKVAEWLVRSDATREDVDA